MVMMLRHDGNLILMQNDVAAVYSLSQDVWVYVCSDVYLLLSQLWFPFDVLGIDQVDQCREKQRVGDVQV